MSIVKRYNTLLNLEGIDVFVEEFETSRYINLSGLGSSTFPDSFPQGKTAFLIDSVPFLKPDVEFQIDIFDALGNTIYHEPVVIGTMGYLEGRSRALSVEVYDDTAPGIATMIIVAEIEGVPIGPSIFSDVEEVPIEWQNTYNLRFTKNIQINSAELNNSPVKFYTQPKLTVTEKVYGTLEVTNYGTLATHDLGVIVGEPLGENEGNTFNPTSGYCSIEPDKLLNATDCKADGGTWIEDDSDNQGETNKEYVEPDTQETITNVDTKNNATQNQSFAALKGIINNNFSDRSGTIVKAHSPVDYPYSISIRSEAQVGNLFTNGRIVFSDFNIPVSVDDLKNIHNISNTPDINYYSASIDEVASPKTINTLNPYTYPDDDGIHRILPFQGNGTIEYYRPPSSSFDYTNTVSVADITVSNMRTFSGEVYEAEIIAQSRTQIGDPIVLARSILQPPELMVNTNLPEYGGRLRTGYFGGIDGWKSGSQELDEYFIVSASNMAGLYDGTDIVSQSYQQFDTLSDSVYLSGSLAGGSGKEQPDEFDSADNQLTFQLRDNYSFELKRNVDYTLSFNAITHRDKITSDALMLVYISGSNIPHSTQNMSYPTHEVKVGGETVTGITIEDGTDYGKRIGYLDMSSMGANELTGSWRGGHRIEQNFAISTTTDAIVQFRIFDGEWNISDISVRPAFGTGFSPSYINFLQLMPENFLVRPDNFDFEVNFYDRNGNKADASVVLEDVAFSGSNFVIVGTDNVLKGNMFLGNKEGEGIDFGGAEAKSAETGKIVGGSGYIRSVGYQGFASASDASLGGQYGFMIYSGSVWPGSGDSYAGVGLELVGQSGSLKFRTNPSIFDVQADAFFVGRSSSQFISGSSGNIEISSSTFHVSGGNTIMSGKVTATSGDIGGWTIEDGALTAGSGNSSVTMSGADQLVRMGSGSTFSASDIDGVLFGKDSDGKYKFGVGKGGSYIFFDGDAVSIASEDVHVTASSFIVDSSVFALKGTNLFISSSDGGYISAGNPRPTGYTGANKGVWIQGNNAGDNKTKFLVGDAAGGHLTYDGDSLYMSSSAFFLGGAGQFVSGSLGNIEISSSNFHLTPQGNVTMSGTITATAGNIGGFSITDDALSSTNFFISGSPTVGGVNNAEYMFISSSNFNVKENGAVTASALKLTGGEVAGLTVESGVISVGDILKLKDSGQITGSKVLFSGGKIAGWDIDSDEIKSGTNIGMDSNNKKFTINDTTFGNTGIQFEYNSGTPRAFIGKSTGGYVKFDGSNVEMSSSTFFLGNDTNFISGSLGNIKVSGSSITIATPTLFMGATGSAYISASNGVMQISSSQFHLTTDGDVTASAILLGNKASGNYLQFVGSTLAVRGDITADTISVPSAAATPSSSITSDGLLTTVSASIGGWDIDSTTLSSQDDEIIIDSANKKLIINDATFGNNGIQLDYNSGTPRAFIGNKTGSYLKFDGSSLNVSSSDFLFGNANTFISGAEGGIKISGSGIDILASSFYLGESSNFISGSGGNIFIETDKFELDASDLEISSTEASMSLGEGKIVLQGASTSTMTLGTGANSVTMSADGTDTFMVVGKTGFSQFNQSTEGIIFGSDNGYAKFEVAADSSNYLSFDGQANTLDIKAGTFDLDANTVIVDSGVNGGKIALGATPPTSISSSKGIYFDGTGVALIGNSTGSMIRFDNTNLIMSSSKFLLGDTTNFISGSDGNLKIFSAGETTLTGSSVRIDTPRMFFGATGSAFISASLGGMQISSSKFYLDSSGNVTMTGTVTANAGAIGGWLVDSNKIYSEDDKIRIDSNVSQISMENHALGQSGLQMKYDSSAGDAYFHIGDAINNDLIFNASGLQVAASKLEINATDVEISSTQKSMSLGHDSGNGSIELIGGSTSRILLGKAKAAVTMSADGTDTFLQIGDKTDFGQTTTAGAIFGSDGSTGTGVPSLDLTKGTGNDNYFRFDGTDGLDIKTAVFKLDTTYLDIDSSTARMDIFDTSGGLRTRIGEVDTTSANNYGLVIYDGDGTDPSNELVYFAGGESAARNQIAGWTITNDQISSNNLIIHSSGKLETVGFASNVVGSGWRISSQNGGEAEFENVRIRGTLSTAVFEKETINAVGGQLYVANSTSITGSGIVSASHTTMSVVNVTGFTAGEILTSKRVNSSGFSTEYMYVESSSRHDPSSGTDYRGSLYVIRGYSGSFDVENSGSRAVETGSLSDLASSAQDYEPGQVIVSTGKINTGYIRLNANPNDTTTPYIDIVERTGSAIYDVELKARLGDLSGLSSGLLYGNANPGFGLFTENVFLKGAITAQTGSIQGILHIRTDINNQITMGTNVKNSLDGIHINDSNFWYTNGHFKTGFDDGNYIHQSGSSLTIKSNDFTLGAGNLAISSSAETIKLGTTTTFGSGTGILMGKESTGNYDFYAGNGTQYIHWDASESKLTVAGTINITSGTGFATPATVSGSFASPAAVSASILTATASLSASQAVALTALSSSAADALNTLSGSAAGALTTISGSAADALNTISGSAAAALTAISGSAAALTTTAQTSADTAAAAAVVAQAAIDSMETQVVLDSTGMGLWNGAGSVQIAEYGTTSTFWDGVGHADTNRKLQLNASGITLWGGVAAGNDYLNLAAGSLSMYSNNVRTLHITDHGINIGLSSTGPSVANTPSAVIGNISLHGEGARIYGAATDDYVDVKSDGVDVVAAGVTQAAFGATTTIGPTAGSHILLDGSGLEVRDEVGESVVARAIFATTSYVGLQASEHVKISTSGVEIIDNDRTLATIGSEISLYSDEATPLKYVNIASDGVSVGKNADGGSAVINTVRLPSGGDVYLYGDHPSTYSKMSTRGFQVYKNGAGTVGRVASFGDLGFTVGDLSKAHISSSTLDINISGSFGNYTQISSSGMSIFSDESRVAGFNPYGIILGRTDRAHISSSTYDVNIKEDDSNYTQISSSGMSVFANSTRMAAFNPYGAIIGDATKAHISSSTYDVNIKEDASNYTQISSSGMSVFANSTRMAGFNRYGVIIGDATKGHISSSTYDVKILEDSNNYTEVSSSGMSVFSGGSKVAGFGNLGFLTGDVTKAHISSSTIDVNIKEDSNNYTQISSSGMSIHAGSSGTRVAGFTDSGIILGDVTKAHISSSTYDVNILEDSNNYAQISSSGMSIHSGGSRVAGLTSEGIILGDVTKAHISSSTYDVNIKEDSNNYTQISSSGMSIHAGDGSRVAGFTSKGVMIGDVTQAHISSSTYDVKILEDSDNYTTVSSSGMSIHSAGTRVAGFTSNGVIIGDVTKAHISSSTYDVNILEDNNNYTQISSSGMSIHAGSSATRVAGFTDLGIVLGDVTKAHISSSTYDVNILEDSNNYTQISSSGMSVFANSTRMAGFSPYGVIIGDATKGHVSSSTYDVKILEDSNNYTEVSSSGMSVFSGGSKVAGFGNLGAIIGDATKGHISSSTNEIAIFSDSYNYSKINTGSFEVFAQNDAGNAAVSYAYMGKGLRIGEDATDKSAFRVDNAGNISIGTSNTSNFSVDTAGNLTVTGVISVTNSEDFGKPTLSDTMQFIDTNTWAYNDDKVSIVQAAYSTGSLGLRFAREGSAAWSNHVSSSQIFNRIDSPIFEYDVKIITDDGSQMVGVGNGSGSSYTNMPYALNFTSNDLEYFNGSSNVSSSADQLTVGDVYRVKFAVKSGGGAYVDVYQNGDYTVPFSTYDYGTTGAEPGLFAHIALYNTTKNLEIQGVSVGSPLSTGTMISGNTISTGKIKSNNWNNNNVGSLFDLNAGTAHMGGSGSNAKFYFDGADLSLSGAVTANTGAIGGWTIANSQLTGSSVSKIATQATGDRIVIDGGRNSILMYEAGDFKYGTEAFIGEVGKHYTFTHTDGVSSGLDLIHNKYGLYLSGSVVGQDGGNIHNNYAKIEVVQGVPYWGMTIQAFREDFSPIESTLELGTNTNIIRGLTAIYGEGHSELLGIPVGGTTGGIVGVMGAIKETTSGRWDRSAGVVGVASNVYADLDAKDLGGIPDGQWAIGALGNSYLLGNITGSNNISLEGTIDFKGDTNLYRGATNILKTDDSFWVGGDNLIFGNSTQIAVAATNYMRFQPSSGATDTITINTSNNSVNVNPFTYNNPLNDSTVRDYADAISPFTVTSQNEIGESDNDQAPLMTFGSKFAGASNNNKMYLEFLHFRSTAGVLWTDTGMRIQHSVDDSTFAWQEFGGEAGSYGIAWGTGVSTTYEGVTKKMTLNSSGGLGVGVSPASTAGIIEAANDVIAFSSSDIRFKENVTPISDALFKIQQIRGVEFDWISDKEHHAYDGHDVGVIAQEVEKVLPEVVATRDSGYKAVKYEKMMPLLIEAIKEQQEQIEKLKQQIEEIKNGSSK